MGMLTGVSALLSLAMLVAMVVFESYNQVSLQTLQEARMRSYLSAVETQIRLILLDPTSYICTAQGGISNCRLTTASDFNLTASTTSGTNPNMTLSSTDKIIALLADQPMGICRLGMNSCQFSLASTPVLTTSADKQRPVVQVELVMAGDASYPKVKIEVNPNPEVFQSKSFRCDGFLLGFNADGTPNCQTISTARAPAGSYVSSVDMKTLEPSFLALPSDIRSCANDTQFLQTYEWLGSSNYNTTCGNRLNPFLFGGG